MTNYNTTNWPTSTTRYDSYPEALAALVAKIDTIDDGKTLRYIEVKPIDGGKYWIAMLIYDE